MRMRSDNCDTGAIDLIKESAKHSVPARRLHRAMLSLAEKLCNMPLEVDVASWAIADLTWPKARAIYEHSTENRVKLVEFDPHTISVAPTMKLEAWWKKERDRQEERPKGVPEIDCPKDLQPYLDKKFSATNIAYMVHRAPGTLKTAHKSKWGEPDVPAAGRLPAQWTLRRILPALRRQFEDRIRPPKPD